MMNTVQRPPLVHKDGMMRPFLIVDAEAVDYDIGFDDGCNGSFNINRVCDNYVKGFVAGTKKRIKQYARDQK